jgi:hypothetical protein
MLGARAEELERAALEEDVVLLCVDVGVDRGGHAAGSDGLWRKRGPAAFDLAQAKQAGHDD